MKPSFHRVGQALRRFGVDGAQFDVLVANKLRLANRDSGIGLGGLANKPTAHPLRNSLLWNAVIGAVLSLVVWLLPAVLGLSSYFATLMLLLFMTMLTGYSTLLLDPKDRSQFFTRGVNAATINASRLIVVAWYLLLNAASMGAVGVAATIVRFGVVAGVLGVVGVLLVAVFAIVLAMLVYLLVLRYFDGERLKNLLNFLQIAMMVGVYLASQLLPRLSLGQNGVLTASLSPVMLLVPPVWFATLPLAAAAAVNWVTLLAAVLGVGVTGAMVWYYAKHAATFEQYLAKLDAAENTHRKQSGYFRLVLRLFARSGASSGYFTLAWQHLAQEREYKLRVYPNFAYMLIIPVIFAVNLGRAGGNWWQSLAPRLPYGGLVLLMVVPLGLVNMNFSSQPKAMRVFTYVPFAAQGDLALAACDAFFARLVLPFLLGLTVVGVIADWHAAIGTLAAIAVVYAGTLLIGRRVVTAHLPFAQAFDPNRNATSAGLMVPLFGSMIVGFGLIGVAGFLHTWVFDLALLVLGVVAAWALRRSFKHVYYAVND